MSDSERILAIRERYRESLGEKAQWLEDWRKEFQDAGCGSIDSMELSEWLHKLAGSSGMYDYAEISELARSLMLKVSDSLQLGERSVDFLTDIDKLIMLLKTAKN